MAQKTAPQPKGWTKPELVKLGKLADVAQNPGVGPQGSGDKT